MISSEVQRTLVKSPPELWTELSDPDALARHLNDFGEIRITRVQPETTVEWEADGAAGSVSIKPSGWGTRVTLMATRERPPASAPDGPEPQGAAQEGPARIAEPIVSDGRLSADTAAEPDPPESRVEVEAAAPPASGPAAALAQWQAQAFECGPEPQAEQAPHVEDAPKAEPQPRRTWLSRIFARRRDRAADRWPATRHQDGTELEEQAPGSTASVPGPLVWAASGIAPQAEQAPRQDPVPSAATRPSEPNRSPQTVALEPEPPAEGQDHGGVQEPDISAELAAAEETAAQEVRAVLTSMLDRLGTAHHRPFSRA